jgi:hypothetical protein
MKKSLFVRVPAQTHKALKYYSIEHDISLQQLFHDLAVIIAESKISPEELKKRLRVEN